MCLRCGSEADEPICAPCLGAVFKDQPLRLYPYVAYGTGLVRSLTQEVALSHDGTLTIQRSQMKLMEAIEGLKLTSKERENVLSEHLNKLLFQMGVPLELDIHSPIILLEDDRELIEAAEKRMRGGAFCSNKELCMRMGNILWHYANWLKEHRVTVYSSRAKGLFEDALEYYRKAHSLDHDRVALRNIAIALHALGSHETSLEYIGKLQGAEDSQLHLIKGLNLSALGRIDEALASLKKAVELDPSPPALLESVRLLSSAGRSEEALEVLDEVLKADENSKDAQRLKNELLTKLRNGKEHKEPLKKPRGKGDRPAAAPAPPAEVPKVTIGGQKEKRKKPGKESQGAKDQYEEKKSEIALAKEEYEREWLEFKNRIVKELGDLKKRRAELECSERAIAEREARLREYSASHPLHSEPGSPPRCVQGGPTLSHASKHLQTQSSESIEGIAKLYGAWQDMVAKANDHLKGREYKEALSYYEPISRLSPENLEVWLNKAEALEHLERHEEALSCYDHILRYSRNDKKIWLLKIRMLQALGRFEEAIDAYNELISMFPENEALRIERAKVLIRAGRFEEAVSCLNSIVERSPANIEGHLNLGEALFQLNRYEESYQCFNRMAEIDPRNAEAWYRRGLIQNKWGKWGAAIQFFSWAIALKPDLVEAWMSRGDVLREHGELKEALGNYEKVISLAPRNEKAWYTRAKILWEQGRHKEALTCIEALLRISPKSEMAIGIRERMMERLRKEEEESAKDEEYLMKKAQSLHEEGRSEDSLKLLALGSRLNPDSESVLLRTAAILAEEGKFRGAIDKYTELLKLNPRSEEALMGKAALCMKMGDCGEALVCLDALLKMAPEREEAIRYREECIRRLEEGEDEPR